MDTVENALEKTVIFGLTAADPMPAMSVRPTYLSMDDMPEAATFLAYPDAPADPDPLSECGMISYYERATRACVT